MPIIAIAPIGKGFRMMPTIVAMKIANKCQALGSTPTGLGTNQIRMASATTASNDRYRLPFFFGCPVSGATASIFADIKRTR
jgi:hypothetical protein